MRDKIFQPLYDVLPGALANLDIGSQRPNDIIKLLDQYNKPFDTMLLNNGDVWRYFDSYNQIFNHPKLINKPVFLQTLGYTNKYFGNSKWELSYPIHYWPRWRLSNSFSPKSNNLNYGFSCLNNRASIDRLVLGYNFYINNLLDKIIFSQNLIDSVNSINRVIQDFSFDRFNEFLKLLPIRILSEANRDQLVDFRNFKGVVGGWANQPHPAFDDAYCQIYVESECEEYPYTRNINLPVMTEKSHKPFIARQLPVALAARGHLAYLKGLGFETFDDLLSTGYDDMKTLEKIDCIVLLVKKGNDFIKDYYFNHLREIQHNYELVNSDKVEDLILERIKDIIQ